MKFTYSVPVAALMGAVSTKSTSHDFELFQWACQGNDAYSYDWDDEADTEFTMDIDEMMQCLRDHT